MHCYVFDIAPKQIVGKKRYFQGRIWVDDHDFQIVKTYGQAVPEIRDTKKKGKEEHLYPKFTTWRQQIDGKYWFPTYTRADDTLHFNLNDIHIREIVKYEDYKRFGSSVKILYQGTGSSEGGSEDQKAPDQNPEAGRAESAAAAEVAVSQYQPSANAKIPRSLGMTGLSFAQRMVLAELIAERALIEQILPPLIIRLGPSGA